MQSTCEHGMGTSNERRGLGFCWRWRMFFLAEPKEGGMQWLGIGEGKGGEGVGVRVRRKKDV